MGWRGGMSLKHRLRRVARVEHGMEGWHEPETSVAAGRGMGEHGKEGWHEPGGNSAVSISARP